MNLNILSFVFLTLLSPMTWSLDSDLILLSERKKIATTPELNLDQKKALVMTSQTFLESLLFDRSYKEKASGLNFKNSLDSIEKKANALSSYDFLEELTLIFNSIYDAHTDLYLPEPYSLHRTVLPFTLFMEKDNNGYTLKVSALLKMEHPEIQKLTVGDELVAYENQPIKDYINEKMKTSDQGSPEAQLKYAALQLHMIHHKRRLFPKNNFVGLTFKNKSGEKYNVTLPYYSTTKGLKDIFEITGTNKTSNLFELVPDTEYKPGAHKILNFKGQKIIYIKMTEMAKNAKNFVDRILDSHLDAKGIVLDLRDNSGGSVVEGETVAQTFIEPVITPMSYSYRLTPALTFLIQNTDPDFFNPEVRKHYMTALSSGKEFTPLFPRTDDATLNAVARKLTQVPMLVIANAGCFSSCENTVAILKDSGRAWIVGENDSTTNGAGAIVEKHSEFLKSLTKAGTSLEAIEKAGFTTTMPTGFDLRVAWRGNFRTTKSSPLAIENNGVEFDTVYYSSLEDHLNGYEVMIHRLLTQIYR